MKFFPTRAYSARNRKCNKVPNDAESRRCAIWGSQNRRGPVKAIALKFSAAFIFTDHSRRKLRLTRDQEADAYNAYLTIVAQGGPHSKDCNTLTSVKRVLALSLTTFKGCS